MNKSGVESLQKHPRCCCQKHGLQSATPGLHVVDGMQDAGQDGLARTELLARSG